MTLRSGVCSFARAISMLVLGSGCSAAGGGARVSSSGMAQAGEAHAVTLASEMDTPEEDQRRSGTDAGTLHVLVTGFHDWKELGDPPNVWRCRVNPSCRLLLGEASEERPTAVEGGALVDALRGIPRSPDGRVVQWSFATLPVTWGASNELALGEYELVVHLGLGVYDGFDRILVERGAYNLRSGADARGNGQSGPITEGVGAVLMPDASSGIPERLAELDGRALPGGFTLVVADAREQNSYLCNETHFHALQQLAASAEERGRLERAHFVHIPYAKDDDYARLAEGVQATIEALLP